MDEELKYEVTQAAMESAERICGTSEEVSPLRSLVCVGFLEGVAFGVQKGADLVGGYAAQKVMELLKEKKGKERTDGVDDSVR